MKATSKSEEGMVALLLVIALLGSLSIVLVVNDTCLNQLYGSVRELEGAQTSHSKPLVTPRQATKQQQRVPATSSPRTRG